MDNKLGEMPVNNGVDLAGNFDANQWRAFSYKSSVLIDDGGVGELAPNETFPNISSEIGVGFAVARIDGYELDLTGSNNLAAG